MVASLFDGLPLLLTGWRVNLTGSQQQFYKSPSVKAETKENDDNELLMHVYRT